MTEDPDPPPMIKRWTGLRAPLSMAAYVTWSAVAISLLRQQQATPRAQLWSGTAALLGMLALFLWRAAHDAERRTAPPYLNVLAQGVLVVIADRLLGGDAVVLLIIVATQAMWCWRPGIAALLLAAFNLPILWHWSQESGGLAGAALQMVSVLAFQAFAALTAWYAIEAERSRTRLAHINAELLATQQLLQQSTRTDERLRLSRELHDVSGHKLTALKLQLTRLARDPALGGHAGIAICAQLTDELLADLRGVVGALRQHDGLELGSALRALALPLSGVHIDVHVPDGLRVASIAQAETLLRAAQEGITNALKHGNARQVQVDCAHTDEGLLLQVTNDGARPAQLRFGHGLTGMQERVSSLGGRLSVDSEGAGQGLRLCVWLPETPA